MRKTLCILLVLIMVLGVMPTHALASGIPDDATPVTFSGDGKWLTANATVDHGKDLEIGYDVHFSSIATCTTPNTWADEGKLVIRNAAADHYIYFSLQTFCTGQGKYQIAVSSQVWSGSAWSERTFVWSPVFDTPVTDVHMRVCYNARTATYSWTLTNSADNTVLTVGAVSPAVLTEELRLCKECALTFFRTTTDVSIANVYLLQSDISEAGELPEGAIPMTFTGENLRMVANVKADHTRSFELGFDMNLPQIASCTTPNTWADSGKLVIRNPVADHYIYFCLQSFCSGQGKYLVAASSQVWSASAWSERVFVWSQEFDSPITAVHMLLNYDAETAGYTWTLTNSDDNSVLNTGTVDPSVMTESLKNYKECEIIFQCSTTDMAIQNAYLLYASDAEESPAFDETKTPADFGWSADDNNFENWETTTTGEVFYICHNGTGSQRIWKSLISDPDNFTVKLTVQVQTHRAYIEVMDVPIELDCSGGNGNQICEKLSGSYQWLDAKEQTCDVTVARANGGALTIKLEGKNNSTPMTFTKEPVNEANLNVIIGVYDNPGAAYFSNIHAMGLEGQNVADFGWETDEVAGIKDYSGWTSVDGVSISANYDMTVGNHRIWKSLITNPESFTAHLTIALQNEATAYVQVLGQKIAFDSRGGGERLRVIINDEEQGWIDAEAYTAELFLTRKEGGALQAAVLGKGSLLKLFAISPLENGSDLELGACSGITQFSDITVKKPSECMRALPFSSAVFAGESTDVWTDQLCTDIIVYQNSALKKTTVSNITADDILAANGDLIVLAHGVNALLSGVPADNFIAEYRTLLTDVKSGMQQGGILVITGLPYLTEDALGDISVETYAAYNAKLRALAREMGILFADFYSAMGNRDWTVLSDGKTFSAVGNALAAGEVLERLMRSCSCLAVNSTTPLRTTLAEQPVLTDAALNAFKTATSPEQMRAAVADKALGLNLVLYHLLTSQQQNMICQALLEEDRSGITDFDDADLVFTTVLMQVTRSNSMPIMDHEISNVLAVGASCTEGTAAVNPKTDAWPIRLGYVLNTISPDTYTVTNKGIAGTRMCTSTSNGLFPAAKDTVDEYIVPCNPDLLLITYGFNDINAGTGLEEYITTFRSYLAEIQEKCPNTIIVLGSIQPTFGETNKETAAVWSGALKGLAEEMNCIFAYNYDDVCGVNWLLSDGVHPTNAGYRVMANSYLRILNAYLDLSGKEPLPTFSPAEFGWETDEIGGVKDFSGWAAEDAANLSAEYNATTGEHRIWKNLLTNQNDFTAELDILTDNTSSAYVKVLGVTLELDSSGGDGNQSFVKLNGQNQDWVKGDNCEMHVKLERKDGGDLTITVTGKNGDTMDLTATPTEENENLELGLYRGIASYNNITVTCEAVTPATYLVTFVDGLTGETIATDAVEEGNAATAPEAPAHEGYTFKGWDKDFSNVTADLTVTALYEKNEEPPKPAEYTVTFVDGLTNETISTVKVEEGKAATAPEAPAHEGYTFKGWDKDFSNVTADLTVTAQYEKNEEPPKPAEYTVTFVDGLTNETISTVKVEEGKAATAPEAPAHEGYTFKGWDKDFSNVTADLTVTAQYEKNEEPPKPVEYTVTFVDGLTNETISTVKVEEGKAATAPEAPAHEGYTFKGWDKDFSNVTADLTVTAQYEKNEEPPKPWVNPFKDVKESDWYYEGVKFAAQNELFNGTSPTTFEPDGDMTRAMLVTVLWRLDGKPAPKSLNSFKDVPSGQWYTEAVAWASENGVVDGVGNNLFEPDGNVTREQIAAIMYRYAGKKGYDTTKRADLSKYPDADRVSSYAKEALSWANAEGLINGTNNGKGDVLDPKGSATRAQVATILMRYVKNIVQK